MSNRKNLANGILALGVSDTDTTWVLQNGYGAGMPNVPFYLTATPFGQLSTMGNSEIVNVTARTTDTLTVQRGAKGTTAKAFAAGAVVSNGIYTDEKWTSDNIDWATFGAQITGMYPFFLNQSAQTGSPGQSYTSTHPLPRPIQQGESIMLIPVVMRWCTAELLDNTSTTFRISLHNTIATQGMRSAWSAIYFKAH